MTFQLSDLAPDKAAIRDLATTLANTGLIPSWPEDATYVEVEGKDCIVSVEPRPHYCDRGRWIVKPRLKPGRSSIDLNVDEHDGFPRYYFGDVALANELMAWLRARGQV